VAGGVLAAEAERVNERWLTVTQLGRPYVLWKYAATLDGRVAAADRTSRWITGPEARADVHALRAECDAIVVGIGTVLADDPHLTVREGVAGGGEGSLAAVQPLRVVVDTRGRTPSSSRVLDDAAETWVATAAELGHGPGGHVDLHSLVKTLHEGGRQSVLVEGGPTLAGGFVRAGLVDRVVGYVAPALLGAGPAALVDAGIGTISDALRLELDDIRRLGPDLRLSARVPRGES
jgi:diaminohydroxyphosphoribosylaminopyrimidine deaminase/5-amino-6-(5-phosphoribosylamino)uracil reductase